VKGPRARGLALVALACAFIAACAQLVPRDRSDFRLEDQDFDLIADASLKMIERTHRVAAFVVPTQVDARARAALQKLRPVIRPTELQSSDIALPAEYFIVEHFTIEDAVAQVEGQIGPITRTAEGKNLPGCGLRFSMAFYWEIKEWRSHSYKILDCAQMRSWTPVD
jgi:hypothetical protein